MNDPRQIRIADYTYELPAEKIALHPLPERDSSKLLIFRNNLISDDYYSNIAEFLPGNAALVFNDTRVINARLHFKTTSGKGIEIFCLEPAKRILSYNEALSEKQDAAWKCLVGGAAKWKDEDLLLQKQNITLRASKTERLNDAYLIKFSWEPGNISFAQILSVFGNIPLPPYIKREPGSEDSERYQTTFANHPGSVAAPTAGLHFTDRIFEQLKNKGISRQFVTLHVGAGTFKPVKADVMAGHDMHAEWIQTSAENLLKLAEQDELIAVGTTSLRSLESFFWFGYAIIKGEPIEHLDQWYPYHNTNTEITYQDAFSALASNLKAQEKDLFAQTSLLIAPGYKFRTVKGLVTNFHQPGSTLLLLVAAALGENWKWVYEHALKHDYRFLSYGDGNLIFFDQG